MSNYDCRLVPAMAGLALAIALTGTSAASGGAKIGMITTLSGGGSSLGIDVRDGFMLAVQQSGRDDIEVVVDDDQRKPDIAVQLADKMVQGESVLFFCRHAGLTRLSFAFHRCAFSHVR